MFGACEGSLLIKKTLPKDYETIAICDNNILLEGTSIDGVEIIRPDKIKDYDYDYVIISNTHGNEIEKQLIEIGVTKECIIDYYKGKMFDNRLGVLRLIAQQIYSKELLGAVAELGVYKGEFAYYINSIFNDRECYLFDTFEGFDIQDCNYEKENSLSIAQETKFSDTNVDYITNLMIYADKIHVKKGYFPETTKGLEKEKFCFVSLDADLYKPIYAGLCYFYPRLVKGGYIIIHDYNSVTYKGTKEAVDKFCIENQLSVIPIIDNCGSVVMTK